MVHYRLKRDPRSSHQQINTLLRARKPGLTLDVGAAQGILGELLQGSGLVVDGVEPTAEWAEMARPFYRNFYPTTVEGAQLPDGTYDAVVCADVLEHLPDPLTVLKQLRRAAKPDALFVISLPNIAHFSIRLMLLAGRFPKMERGILDKTHLQFLTKDTATDLLKSAGLKVEKVTATGVPLEQIWKTGEDKALFKLLRGCQNLAVDVWPRMAGFQWIFQARPYQSVPTPGVTPPPIG